MNRTPALALAVCSLTLPVEAAPQLSADGVQVVPHVQSTVMRYRQKPCFSLGARVGIFPRITSLSWFNLSLPPLVAVLGFALREGASTFKMPASPPKSAEVFRLDADGAHDVKFSLAKGRKMLRDRVTVAGIFVVSAHPGLRRQWQTRQATLMAFEKSLGFDPGSNDSDFAILPRLLQ